MVKLAGPLMGVKYTSNVRNRRMPKLWIVLVLLLKRIIREILARIWARSKQQIDGNVNTGHTRPQVSIIKQITSNSLTRVQTTNYKAKFSLYRLLPYKHSKEDKLSGKKGLFLEFIISSRWKCVHQYGRQETLLRNTTPIAKGLYSTYQTTSLLPGIPVFGFGRRTTYDWWATALKLSPKTPRVLIRWLLGFLFTCTYFGCM